MAEGSFIESIGELTNENFDEKMKIFEAKFGKENFSVDDKKVVTYKGKTFKFNDDFFNSKDEFIKEAANKDNDGKDIRDQAEKDLRLLGLDSVSSEQIYQLQTSYEVVILQEKVIEEEPLDPDLENIEEKVIEDISDESKSVEDRLKSLNDLLQKLSKSNEKIGKKLDSLQSMSKEEFQKAIDDRIEKTTNESEKGRLERIKEEVKNSEKPSEETSYGKYILLALLGAGFLNAEMIANSGCMLSRGDKSGTCRAMDFTIINNTDTLNSCDGLPSLCQDPSVLDPYNNKCQTKFTQYPIMKDDTATCSEFCDPKYLINTINNNNVRYNCVKCDIICAFTNTLQTLLNIVKDVANDAFDILKFIEKWAPIIGYIILGILVLYIIYKLYIYYNDSKNDSKEFLIKVDNPTNLKFFSKNKSNYKYGSN